MSDCPIRLNSLTILHIFEYYEVSRWLAPPLVPTRSRSTPSSSGPRPSSSSGRSCRSSTRPSWRSPWPRWARDFHVSVATIQWVATGYLLALALVTPVTGWAVDRFGAKSDLDELDHAVRIGSSLCGLAWSANSLIFFRVLQGIGGGMLLPVGQSILARAAGPQRMGRVMSIIGVPMVMGPVMGPVHRRADRLELQLALDLLHQRADRHHDADPLQSLAAQVRHRRTFLLPVRHARLLSAVTRTCRFSSTPCPRSAPLEASPARPSWSASSWASASCWPSYSTPSVSRTRCSISIRSRPQLHHRQRLHLRHRRHRLRLDVPLAHLLPGGARVSQPGKRGS